MRPVAALKLLTFVLVGTILCGAPVDVRAETIRTGGTGGVFETLKRLGEAYVAGESGAEFEVVPSLGAAAASRPWPTA